MFARASDVPRPSRIAARHLNHAFRVRLQNSGPIMELFCQAHEHFGLAAFANRSDQAPRYPELLACFGIYDLNFGPGGWS
jgi:hypothetical protein